MCGKLSVSVDGGPSGGSRVRRPGSEDPHQRDGNNIIYTNDIIIMLSNFSICVNWVI